MLKETKSSLRNYFIIVAVLNGLASVSGFSHKGSLIATFTATLLAVVAITFAYIAGTFEKSIRTKIEFIKKAIIASLIVRATNYGITIAISKNKSAAATGGIIALAISLFVTIYLLKSVVRISAELNPPPPPLPSEVSTEA